MDRFTDAVKIGRTLEFESATEWRSWLHEHGRSEHEVWLVLLKKTARQTGISFDAAIEEALCFGWIDSQTQGIDHDRYALRFTPRREGGRWSETNRRHAHRLAAEGRLTEWGRRVLPPDLAMELDCPALSAG